ncbi:DNA-binding response regulator [Sporosarcina saromensis]|uniref:DNA-binding response regulator n=1 Tax=Sporosarcina saromensis TaxID=359365 RepID=A0ABU4G7H7_9BACL|nr:DNA-binding response regulator [Sporosarcina saromensis]MDW0112921.1 DNA-binding response regulator [Sporosarcina saromensis]
MRAEEMEQLVRDYHWMVNSVAVIRESMEHVGGLTSKYGNDAAMPKKSGVQNDPVFKEVTRRERRMNKIIEYEKKIMILQRRLTAITDDRESEILHWLLEGKSLRWIGRHMKISDRHIGRLKDLIIRKMCDEE